MIQISLDNTVAVALERKALALGLTLSQYLEQISSHAIQPASTPLSADALIALIQSESSLGPTQYTGTYSREDIYADHD